MAANVVKKCTAYRTEVVLKTKRKIISVEYGIKYHTLQATIPYQTLSTLHFVIIFSIQKVLQL
jgi:hypothetical protein